SQQPLLQLAWILEARQPFQRRGKNLGGDILRLLARLDPAPDVGIDAWQVSYEIEGRLLAAGDPIRTAGHSHPSFTVRVTRGVPIAKCLLLPRKDRSRASFSWSKVRTLLAITHC